MSVNVHSLLISRVKATKMYALLQLDESTDLTDKSHLLAFLRCEYEKRVFKDLLFCKEVLRSNSNDVFEALGDFVKEHEVDWNECVGN